MPTSPMTAWFLTERERKISVIRVSLNISSLKKHYHHPVEESSSHEEKSHIDEYLLTNMTLLGRTKPHRYRKQTI
jgi:hypothetical protein